MLQNGNNSVFGIFPLVSHSCVVTISHKHNYMGRDVKELFLHKIDYVLG